MEEMKTQLFFRMTPEGVDGRGRKGREEKRRAERKGREEKIFSRLLSGCKRGGGCAPGQKSGHLADFSRVCISETLYYV